VEVTGKTLGIVGLGRIGREVARRALGLRMKVIAYDPIVSAQVAEELQVSLSSLDDLLRNADFLTVHVPLAPLTRHLIDARLLGLAKPGLRILNVARGGVVDEAALLSALESGRIAGAALDVFEEEPPRSRALLDHPRVVATPHLGASTSEAQSEVTRQIAIQVGRFFTAGIVENAVNLVGADPALREEMTPWAHLCKRLGGVAGGLAGDGLSRVEVTLFGEVSRFPREVLLVDVLLGLLRPVAGDRINEVNAVLFARERGIALSDRHQESHKSFHALVRVSVQSDRGQIVLDGTLFGRANLRIVRAFGFNIDAIPEGPMIFAANEDRPGIIGHLGTVLGRAGVNIANMSVGRDQELGHALAVLNLDQEPSPEVLSALASSPAIRWVKHVPRHRTE
jgi:D-3-phosphoglycerate dehydrogenase